jgi:hypothetical protein
MASIVTFLGSLPAILSALQAFIAWINKVSGNDPAGLAKEIGQAFQTLNAAQTVEDRQAAAKAVADIITKL